jgi:hypothetical protein
VARVYVQARHARFAEARCLAKLLADHGHVVTSTWHDGPEEEDPLRSAEYVEKDVGEIGSSDAVVHLAEPIVPERGGRFVELGIAWAWRKVCIVVGDGPCQFYTLEGVVRVGQFYTLEGVVRVERDRLIRVLAKLVGDAG